MSMGSPNVYLIMAVWSSSMSIFLIFSNFCLCSSWLSLLERLELLALGKKVLPHFRGSGDALIF
jgi:hypothetical protein